jgi:hypothetical protein
MDARAAAVHEEPGVVCAEQLGCQRLGLVDHACRRRQVVQAGNLCQIEAQRRASELPELAGDALAPLRASRETI